MRTSVKILIGLILLGVLGYFGFSKIGVWLADRNKPRFRTAAMEMGDLRLTVNASGEVTPVLSVKIGSFVSGPIDMLYVDFNDEVKKGQLLAEIDPRLYDAAVARDEAALATRLAEVERVKAELQRAINDEKRSNLLKAENSDFIAQTELDQYRFARQALDAQLKVAEAGIRQAEANLTTSRANVHYTKIISPVDGIVIERTIEPGQTLAASFQTPELFVIAPDLREKVHIIALVDEADIGRLKEAKDRNQPVFFTVDAYQGEIFEKGIIEQIRLSPTVTQSVVTYPVIVSCGNPDLKLLPGMTAMLTFQVSELKNVLKVPNAALRFYPEKEHVRESDQALLDLDVTQDSSDENKATSSLEPPVDDSARAKVASYKRIVWVQETLEEALAAEQAKAEAKKAATSAKPAVVAATSAKPAVVAATQAEPTQAEPTQAEPTQAEPTPAEPTLEPTLDTTPASPDEATSEITATEIAAISESLDGADKEIATVADSGTKPMVTPPRNTTIENSTAPDTAPQAIAEQQYSGKLKAVHIVIGESDYRFTHVISGDLTINDVVVVGLKSPGTP